MTKVIHLALTYTSLDSKLVEMSARWSINYLIPPLAVTAAKKINGMMGLVCTRPSYPVSLSDES